MDKIQAEDKVHNNKGAFMKEKILKAIEDFTHELDIIKDTTAKELKEAEKNTLKLVATIEENKRHDEDRERKLHLALEEIKKKEGELSNLTRGVNETQLDVNRLKEDAERSLRRQQENERTIEALLKVKQDEIERKKQLSEDYEKKLVALKVDFEKLAEDRKGLNDDRNKVTLRERAALLQEQKNSTESQRLQEYDLDLQGLEKQVKFEIKKRNLNIDGRGNDKKL